MNSLDDRPAPPALPQFSRDMQRFLTTTARTKQPSRSPRRVRTYATASLAAAAVVAAAAVGIDHALTGPHSPSVGAHPTRQPGGLHVAAFTVRTNPGGTVTLTLDQRQIFNPNALRQALAHAGVPALITVGSVCYVPGPIASQPFSPPQPQPDGAILTTITPSAIPTGSKLSIGYFHVPGGSGVHITVVPDNTALTCTATPPAPPAPRH
jgi:hypothetical protein